MNSTQSHGSKELMYLHAGVHERDMKALMRSDQLRPVGDVFTPCGRGLRCFCRLWIISVALLTLSVDSDSEQMFRFFRVFHQFDRLSASQPLFITQFN